MARPVYARFFISWSVGSASGCAYSTYRPAYELHTIPVGSTIGLALQHPGRGVPRIRDADEPAAAGVGSPAHAALVASWLVRVAVAEKQHPGEVRTVAMGLSLVHRADVERARHIYPTQERRSEVLV